MHVIASGVGSTSSRRFLHYGDNFGTTLLNLGQEGAIEPLIILDYFTESLVSNGCVVNIRVLGGGVITPDNDVVDFLDGSSSSLSDLTNSSALIESCKSIEVSLGD